MYYIELNKLYFRAGDATEDTAVSCVGLGRKRQQVINLWD